MLMATKPNIYDFTIKMHMFNADILFSIILWSPGIYHVYKYLQLSMFSDFSFFPNKFCDVIIH